MSAQDFGGAQSAPVSAESDNLDRCPLCKCEPPALHLGTCALSYMRTGRALVVVELPFATMAPKALRDES